MHGSVEVLSREVKVSPVNEFWAVGEERELPTSTPVSEVWGESVSAPVSVAGGNREMPCVALGWVV